MKLTLIFIFQVKTLATYIAMKIYRFFHLFKPILFILLLVFMKKHSPHILANGRNSLLRCSQCRASNVLSSEMIKAETKEAPSKGSTFYIQSHQLQQPKHKTRDLVGCLHLHFVINLLQSKWFSFLVSENGQYEIKRELPILVGEFERFWRKKWCPTWLVPAVTAIVGVPW